MALRRIAQLGHPVLRAPTSLIEPSEIDSDEVQRLIDDLIDTMREAQGAGLAANQIYESKRVCVMEVGNNPRYPYKPKIPLTVLINPVITPVSDATFESFEGCLSVPNLRGQVLRFAEVRVQALDRHGAPIDQVVRGISAGTFQHECDHLDGKLFLDHVTDPSTFCTWDNFDRYRKAAFVEHVGRVVAKYGS